MEENRIIIGIDPGTNILGFGVIAVNGRRADFVDMGVLDIRNEENAYDKLRQIFDTVTEVCKSYHGTEMAIESPFYSKNAQVILKLGRAQGAAMLAALEQGISVHEYSPRLAKQAITGNGAASKEQVRLVLEKTLNVDLGTRHLDATDALAIAMCHFYACTHPLATAGKGGREGGWERFVSGECRSKDKDWGKFVSEHPERIK